MKPNQPKQEEKLVGSKKVVERPEKGASAHAVKESPEGSKAAPPSESRPDPYRKYRTRQ